MTILNVEQAWICSLALLIPEKFKGFLIFESDEMDDFDIGFKSFFLVSRKDVKIDWGLVIDLDEIIIKARDKYHICSTVDEFNRDNYTIEYFSKFFVDKSRGWDGKIINDKTLEIGWKIRKSLEENHATGFVFSPYYNWKWK